MSTSHGKVPPSRLLKTYAQKTCAQSLERQQVISRLVAGNKATSRLLVGQEYDRAWNMRSCLDSDSIKTDRTEVTAELTELTAELIVPACPRMQHVLMQHVIYSTEAANTSGWAQERCLSQRSVTSRCERALCFLMLRCMVCTILCLEPARNSPAQLVLQQ